MRGYTMVISGTKEKCFGCKLCKDVCESEAIVFEYDQEGFLYPKVDKDKCISCGKCITICKANYQNTVRKYTKVFACSAKNEDVLNNSTSGGIATVFSRSIIRSGGVVYGVTMDDNFIAKHIRVDCESDLVLLQGVKYVQSDMEEVFKNIKDDFEENKHVLFFGTPCQVAALRTRYPKYKRLILVELVCMGVPSPGVWKKYVEEKKEQLGNITKIKFRDKVTGWRSSSITYYTDNAKYSIPEKKDPYMQGFYQGLYLRPICYKCNFKGDNSFGDLKIGDFWGIGNRNNEISYKNGVSLVIVESDCGKELLDLVRNDISIIEEDYRFAVSNNHVLEISDRPSKQRRSFFDSYEHDEKPIGDLIVDNLNPEFDEYERMISQYTGVLNLLNIYEQEESIRDYFVANEYYRVAVYGLGELGKRLVRVLKKNNIEVVCIIDKNYGRFPREFEGTVVIGPHELTDDMYDCLIITLMHLNNSVLKTLMAQKFDLNKIISLGGLV